MQDDNNLNSVAFANFSTLQSIGLVKCGWVLLNNQTLVFVVLNTKIPNATISISRVLFRRLGVTSCSVTRNPEFGVRPFQLGSRMNYLPRAASLADQLTITCISNKNSWLLDADLLRSLIREPFVCREGDILCVRVAS